MARYIDYNYNQSALISISFQDQLSGSAFRIIFSLAPSNAAREWSGTHKELAAKRDKIKKLIRYHQDHHQQQDLLENNDEELALQKQRSEQAIETFQGYNGIATVDKKHQIVVHAQAFGEGQEHHTLQPILESIKVSFNDLGIHDNILASSTIITADTGFANEANMQYLHENSINAFSHHHRTSSVN